MHRTQRTIVITRNRRPRRLWRVVILAPLVKTRDSTILSLWRVVILGAANLPLFLPRTLTKHPLNRLHLARILRHSLRRHTRISRAQIRLCRRASRAIRVAHQRVIPRARFEPIQHPQRPQRALAIIKRRKPEPFRCVRRRIAHATPRRRSHGGAIRSAELAKDVFEHAVAHIVRELADVHLELARRRAGIVRHWRRATMRVASRCAARVEL